MIEIPLVYENDQPNVMIPHKDEGDIYNQHFSKKFHRQVPWLLQTYQPNLNLISSKEIDEVDWFIYPVIMNEPYYQIRMLIGNYQMDYGFWNFVSNAVIEALKAKKGWILIDATLEPLNDVELKSALESLQDTSKFPNDRVLINVSSLKHINHPQVVAHPSFLEMHYNCRHMFDMPSDQYLEGGVLQRKNIYVPSANELEPEGSVADVVDEEKRFCTFQMRWWKHKGCAQLLAMLDKIDAFKKGYCSADGLEDFNSLYKNVRGVDTRVLSFSNVGGGLNHIDDIYPPFNYVAPYVKKSGFNIVTEAYYDNADVSFRMITEKTWRNISYKKPFVLIGQKHTLKKLHELGYRTFSPFIDESYDNSSDGTRVFQAFVQAKKLIDMPDHDFNDLVEKCEPVFIHNQKNYEMRLTDTYNFFLNLRNSCDS